MKLRAFEPSWLNKKSSGTILELSAQTLYSMKKILSFGFAALIIFTGCHRHTVPATSANTATPNSTTVSVYTSPVIIVDAHGNIVASANDLPPTADKSILNIENARAYTPEQTKNLAYRYKYVPPKILFVPDALTKTSNRGTYYVYKTKFWYWKKTNGYFYLDETYYD